MKIGSMLVCAGAVCAAAGAAGAGQVFRWDFRVDIISGPLKGDIYLGDFRHTGAPAPDGSVALDELNFFFINEHFTREDDADFPGYPVVLGDADGDFDGIDYLVNFGTEGEGPQPGFRVLRDEFTYALPVIGFGGIAEGEGVVTYTLVPNAGAAALFGVAGLAGIRRRRV